MMVYMLQLVSVSTPAVSLPCKLHTWHVLFSPIHLHPSHDTQYADHLEAGQ